MDTTTEATESSTVTIKPVGDLYCRYDRQTNPQPCYVELDPETRTLSADWDSEIGNAVPADVWHGRRLRWQIPVLKQEVATALLERLAPLAARVCDGHSVRWDGSNHVGELDEDAQDASETIEHLCDEAGDDPTDCESVWDAADWLGGIGNRERQAREIGISASSTDEELEAIVRTLREEARTDDVRVEGLGEYLEGLRDELRDAG